MSAWYVLSSMGVYQVTPGQPIWEINKPLLDAKVSIDDNKPNYLHLPNKRGVLPQFGMERVEEKIVNSIIPVPVIQSESKSFKDKMILTIVSQKVEDKMYYIVFEKDIDYSATKMAFIPYSKPFIIETSSTVMAFVKKDEEQSKTISATFFKKPNDYTIDIKSNYNPQYHAGGSDGLIDGIFGTTNWRKGDWQGYQSQDFEATVDLQGIKLISEIHSNYLQDQRSWILMPTKVEYFTSIDNIHFTLVATIDNDINPKKEDNSIKDFKFISNPINARYVKVKAYNFGKLPEWHQGFGGDAFIFIDEITIK